MERDHPRPRVRLEGDPCGVRLCRVVPSFGPVPLHIEWANWSGGPPSHHRHGGSIGGFLRLGARVPLGHNVGERSPAPKLHL